MEEHGGRVWDSPLPAIRFRRFIAMVGSALLSCPQFRGSNMPRPLEVDDDFVEG